MSEKEALKILAREEERFKDAGFGRGVVLAKSAHDYHKAIGFCGDRPPAQDEFRR